MLCSGKIHKMYFFSLVGQFFFVSLSVGLPYFMMHDPRGLYMDKSCFAYYEQRYERLHWILRTGSILFDWSKGQRNWAQSFVYVNNYVAQFAVGLDIVPVVLSRVSSTVRPPGGVQFLFCSDLLFVLAGFWVWGSEHWAIVLWSFEIFLIFPNFVRY